MKKLGMLFTGFVFMLVLGACSDSEVQEVVDVQNDLNNVLEEGGVEETVEEVQNLLQEFDMQQISNEEFEERSEEMLEALNSMEESLESVEKHEEERAGEYYESSYDMGSKSIDGMYEALDIPGNLEDEEQLMEYQERVQQKQEEEMEAVEKVEDLREELEEDGVEFEDS